MRGDVVKPGPTMREVVDGKVVMPPMLYEKLLSAAMVCFCFILAIGDLSWRKSLTGRSGSGSR